MSAKHGRTDGTCAHFVPAETCPDCKRPFEPEGNAVSDRADLIADIKAHAHRGTAPCTECYDLTKHAAIALEESLRDKSDLQALRERETSKRRCPSCESVVAVLTCHDPFHLGTHETENQNRCEACGDKGMIPDTSPTRMTAWAQCPECKGVRTDADGKKWYDGGRHG